MPRHVETARFCMYIRLNVHVGTSRIQTNVCTLVHAHARRHSPTHARKSSIFSGIQYNEISVVARCYLKISIPYKGNLSVFNAIEMQLLLWEQTRFSERCATTYYVVAFFYISLNNCDIFNCIMLRGKTEFS